MAEPLVDTKASNLLPKTFIDLYRKLRAAERLYEQSKVETDSLRGRTRAVRKEMKDSGVDLAAFAIVEQLRALEDDEAETRMRAVARYSAYLEMPIGEQLDMFGGEKAGRATEDARDFMAEDKGYKAGFGGQKTSECPYSAGTSEFDRWTRSWHEGQAALVHKVLSGKTGDGDGDEPAQPKSRGRPRKDGTPAQPRPPGRTGTATSRRKVGAEAVN